MGRRAHSMDVQWPWGGKDLDEAENMADGTRGRVVRNEVVGSTRAHITWGLEGHGSTPFL